MFQEHFKEYTRLRIKHSLLQSTIPKRPSRICSENKRNLIRSAKISCENCLIPFEPFLISSVSTRWQKHFQDFHKDFHNPVEKFSLNHWNYSGKTGNISGLTVESCNLWSIKLFFLLIKAQKAWWKFKIRLKFFD